MKYIKIEYSVKNIRAETIAKFEKVLISYEAEYFKKLVERYPGIDLSNINVVLSDDIWRDIDAFYEEHGQKLHNLRPKGHDHVVKYASAPNVKKIFWTSKYTSELGIKLFFKVLIENLIGEHLVHLQEINTVIDTNTCVSKITDQLFDNWLLHLITIYEASTILTTENLWYDKMDDLTFSFKKNIKHLHFKYQKDLDKYLFIINVILELEIFIRRVLTYKTQNNLNGFEEFKFEINSIIELLENMEYDFSNLNKSIYMQNNKHVLSILKKCDVEIYDSKTYNNIGFKVSEGPKMLFPDLIDTHPRIICFIDILGFKALIQEYETNNISLVLKRLQRVFDVTRKAAFEILINTFQKDIKDQLDFKMFSDCITIALPYIEFGVDVKSGFHSMAIILNVLQQTFMKEGFYVRGHITLGSYYADENMLFSGGLVEAYENESKTVYPAISVNKKIITKLLEKTAYDDSLPSMNSLIIEHKFITVNNKILNPFFTHDSFKSLDNDLDNIFDGSFIGLGGILKGRFSNVFQEQGINLEEELANDLKIIKEKLIENYNNQLEIYYDLDNSHIERTIASSVLDKYSFLIDLLNWYEGTIDERFEYYLKE